MIIGIDPDIEKSGVVVKMVDKYVGQKLRFFELFDYLSSLQTHIKIIYIESGWQNAKSNYHNRPGQTNNVGERIAKNVGANHETGRKIVEMCDYLKIPYKLQKPTKSKVVNREYFKRLTGITTCSQEIIDAGMLIVGR